jgi:hypothetical protein
MSAASSARTRLSVRIAKLAMGINRRYVIALKRGCLLVPQQISFLAGCVTANGHSMKLDELYEADDGVVHECVSQKNGNVRYFWRISGPAL